MMTANKHAVVMACDSNYAPYAFFLAQQIIKAHENRDFDICIFSQDALQLPEALQHLGLRLETIPAENPFRNGPNQDRHGEACYLRLMLPRLVAGRYERLLYLDSDIFLNGELSGLLHIDMCDAAIAAVRDNSQWRTPNRLLPEFKTLQLPATPYFNSGMLLIDVARYQTEQILEQCLELLKNHPEALPRHDQSLLNLVMRGKWTEVSPVWNWQYTWSSRFFADIAEPRLVHFIGPRKPWKDSDNVLPRRYRQAYVTFLNAHYPRWQEALTLDDKRRGWPNKLGKMFFKHMMSAARMKRYLNKFEDDLQARAQ